MTTFRHWTPRYIVNRTKVIVYERRHPRQPWLTSAAVELLRTLLRPTDVGLEWGAGRSTLWLAARVAFLTSIEHDPKWYTHIQYELEQQRVHNVDLEFHGSSSTVGAAATYVSAIEHFEECSLDFVLVDGLERDNCANAAIDKLKAGGVLIIDDCDRYLPSNSYAPASRHTGERPSTLQWEQFLFSVQGWRYIWTSNGVSDTGLWIKS